jgi:hypothetical protein
MAIIGGLKPSELDAATVEALQIALGYDSGSEMMYGQGIVNIKRKLNNIANYGKPASSIRIAVFADSIFASSTIKQSIIDYFNDNWAIPEVNIDVNCCWGGYAPESFIPCLESAVIKPNVDLFIFSENEHTILDQMIALVRAKTNADIMFGTWTVKADTGYPRYDSLVDIAKKYNCELFDINGLLLRKYLDGTVADYQIDGLHLSATGAAYIFADFVKHFESTRYYNEYVNPDTVREEIFFLGSEKLMPTKSYITFSGSWSVQGSYAVGSKGGAVRSSTATDYIEFTFAGVGFEMLFLDSGTQNDHTILVDGAAPSAYSTNILEYCTQIIGKTQTNSIWYFHRFFAAQVTAPFMTNDEVEVEFEITIDSVTRDGGGVATAVNYTLRQGVDVLGTGDIFTDATFVFRTTGEITIPAQVYETPNFIELGVPYVFTAGDTMQFFARKTWKDTIDTNAETFLRIAGLARASHTVRITKEDNVATDAVYLSLYK